MSKRSKFKIPTRSGNRKAKLEKQYQDAIVKMVQLLFPDEGYDTTKNFIRVSVNDIVNPITHMKEYGVIIYFNDTVFSIVEAFDGINDAVKALCMEGLSVGRNLCLSKPPFPVRSLKAVIFDREPDKDLPDEIIVNRDILNKTPFVVSRDELQSYKAIFRQNNGVFPIRVFNTETNPKASLCFEEAKKILSKIPSMRVPRGTL